MLLRRLWSDELPARGTYCLKLGVHESGSACSAPTGFSRRESRPTASRRRGRASPRPAAWASAVPAPPSREGRPPRPTRGTGPPPVGVRLRSPRPARPPGLIIETPGFGDTVGFSKPSAYLAWQARRPGVGRRRVIKRILAPFPDAPYESYFASRILSNLGHGASLIASGTSHNRRVLSSLAERRKRPSGETAALRTLWVCPVKLCKSFPDLIS